MQIVNLLLASSIGVTITNPSSINAGMNVHVLMLIVLLQNVLRGMNTKLKSMTKKPAQNAAILPFLTGAVFVSHVGKRRCLADEHHA